MANPTQIVLFGASGDLAARKLVPALLSLAAKGRVDFHLVGVARSPLTDEAFRAKLRAELADEDREAFRRFAERVHYVQGDAVGDLQSLAARLADLAPGAPADRLFYLALKPELFLPAVENLARNRLLHQDPGEPWRRVVIEKPFGHDLASAQALNRTLHRLLREDQIYRIDHYLGKETVQNLFAEELGVERGRAAYYDSVGALRDMLQNHMLQILAMVAMEPPSSLDPETIRDQKVAVLKSLRILPGENNIRGRYSAGELGGQALAGYLQEEGVRPDSTTETYVAIRAEVENWRWSGVPFLLRHGKRLPRRFTEVVVQFRVPPIQLFDAFEAETRSLADGSVCQLRPNHLSLSIQPREAVALRFGVKAPGAGMTMVPAELSFDYRDRFGAPTAPAYERLLLDAMTGDPTLFLRNDEVEAAWRAVDALQASPLLDYPAGTWGPPEADQLFHGCEGTWSRG
jgi:glucose-6-phosphate 1-dehydrogenase